MHRDFVGAMAWEKGGARKWLALRKFGFKMPKVEAAPDRFWRGKVRKVMTAAVGQVRQKVEPR
jgi:hypothetical protein